MISILHKRKPVNSVNKLLKSNSIITSSTTDSTPDSLSPINDFKLKLKKHVSPKAYNDLESHWKLIGVD